MSIRFQEKSMYLVMLAAAMCVSVAVFIFAFVRGTDDPTTKMEAPTLPKKDTTGEWHEDTIRVWPPDDFWNESPSEAREGARSSVASKHGQSARDEHLAANYRALKSVYAGGWKDAAFSVGTYGDPDEATEAILDLIENRDDVTRENLKELEDWHDAQISKLNGGDYRTRIEVLTYLGLTRTKRAEEFLLNAYKNPQDIIPNKKYMRLANEQRALGYDMYAESGFIDSITRRYALTGLLVLNEPKYSQMLEEEFYALVPDTERIHKKARPYGTEKDSDLLGRFGVLLDLMLVRDVIRERDTENPEYLLNPNALKGDLTKYWNFHTETAVPRQ